MKFVCSKMRAHTSLSQRRNAHCGCGGLWKLDFTPEKFELSRASTRTSGASSATAEYMALDGESWRGVTHGRGHDTGRNI